MAAALNVDGNDIVEAVVDMGQHQQGESASSGGGNASASATASFNLPRALGAVGVLTGGMAAAYRSPPAGTLLARSGGPGYYLALGFAFAAGVAEVWAALWIAGDAPGRRSVGTKLLCAAAIPFLIVVAVGGFAVQFKN